MLRTVFKNASYLLTHQIINKLLFTALIIFIARYLGPESLGEYAFVFVFEYILILLVSLGSRTLIVRELSKEKSLVPRITGNIMVINVILLLMSLPLVLLVSTTFYPGKLYILVRLIWFDAFLASFISIFTSILRAHEKMRYEALIFVIHDLIVVVGSILLILNGFGVTHIILMFILGKAISFIYLSRIMIKHYPRPSFDIDIRLCKTLILKSIPFLASGVFILIIFRLDILMLGFMRNEAEVGIYEAGYAIIRNLQMMSLVFIAALFPLLSKLHGVNDIKLFRIYKKAFRYLLAINLALMAVVIVFSKIIITLLYGPLFSEATGLLRLLIVGGFFLNMSALNTSLLNAIKKESKNVIFVGFAAGLNIVLNLLFIPKYGYYGAALVTLATYVLLFIIQICYITKETVVGCK